MRVCIGDGMIEPAWAKVRSTKSPHQALRVRTWKPLPSPLILLLAVVVSGALARMSPVALPLPLVQIAIGALIAAVADLGVELRPDIFFLLFLPPLLFLDGWRIPRKGCFVTRGRSSNSRSASSSSRSSGVGYFVNWLIPAMPLAVAFALAAIISPDRPDRRVCDRRACADPASSDAYPRRGIPSE